MGFEIREASGGGRVGLSGAGLGMETSGTVMLEDAVMDLMPDDVQDMMSKRRVQHWDRRKKKFVQVRVIARVFTVSV